eukprot:7400510-Ditylum_brightwellii.AAC.1
MTGIILRVLIKLIESQKTINKGQIGGRARHNANKLTFLEEIKNDTTRCSRKPLINFDNDAASCYGRIIPNLANLIGKKKSLHRNITFIHAKTLEEAKFKFKTALGVSESFYNHSQVFPIYGMGQGSTNFLTIWLIIGSTLFDVYQEMCYGATFCDPKKKTKVHITMVGFVDDTKRCDS